MTEKTLFDAVLERAHAILLQALKLTVPRDWVAQDQNQGVQDRKNIAAAYISSLPDSEANRAAVQRLRPGGRASPTPNAGAKR